MFRCKKVVIRACLTWVALAAICLCIPHSLVAAHNEPSVSGQWEGPNAWPLIAIHVMVMHTGKTLQFSYNSNSYVWDPVSGSQSPWASMRSSTRFQIWSRSSSAAVWGSSMAAW